MTEQAEQARTTTGLDYEVIVIGAGVGGIYQIKRLTDLGVKATVLEGADDLGGTWYMNRYPGARFDSESYTYGYSFSRELLDEWHWKERFSGQPENLRYLNHVADKFDLRRHMQFNTTVAAMRWDEPSCTWEVTLDDGRVLTARFVITALGLLSIPTPPRFEGMEEFQGQSFHTFHWPKEPVELAGKRVGVIGTGATAIQVIGDIGPKVGELKVFQRRPNWSAPLNNGPISDEEMADIRARYDEIFATCARTPGGFEHEPDRRGFWNVTREERVALWTSSTTPPGSPSGSATSGRSSSTRRPTPSSRSTSPTGSVSGSTIRWWPRSSSPGTTASGCSGCRWRRTTSRSTTRTTWNWSTSAKPPSSGSRPPASRPPPATTNSTSSSTPPGSTPSPGPTTGSTSKGSTGRNWPSAGWTGPPPTWGCRSTAFPT